MTALRLADAGEAADLAAFLARLIHYDRRAVVRIQTGGGVLAVFGRPAAFEVLAIRTAQLAAEPAGPAALPGEETSERLDETVSAGQLADAIDASGAIGATGAGRATDAVPTVSSEITVTVPQAVTGPAWAGLLPPRGGWQRVGRLPGVEAVRAVVATAVTEFRTRIEALPEAGRTRAELDGIGREIWSQPLGDTELPLRAAHAAQSLGFLRPVRAPAPAVSRPGVSGPGVSGPGVSGPAGGVLTSTDPEPLTLLSAGGWLRLRTPYGSIAVRTAGLPGLSVTPA